MLKVFVSYAREDIAVAMGIYGWLAAIGMDPWIDQEKLLPGQNWEAEIERAFAEANVILLLMSPRSVTKRGFVTREANEAMQRLIYKLPTDVYVIPIILEACDVPDQITRRLQFIDWGLDSAKRDIEASLKLAAEQQSVAVRYGVEAGPFIVRERGNEQEWQGSPGFSIRVRYPQFASATLGAIAAELTELFAGRAADACMKSRSKLWEQVPAAYADWQSAPMDGRWDDYEISFASERALSLRYSVGWYGAGAAHPNSHFETHNFVLAPHIVRFGVEDLFKDYIGGIKRLSEISIEALRQEYLQRVGEVPDAEMLTWIASGAGEEADNFRSFTMNDMGLTILFAAYQVGPYALGSWSVDVTYAALEQYLRPDGPASYFRAPLTGVHL